MDRGADILLPPPAPLSFFLLFFFPSFLSYFSLMSKHVGGAGAPPAPTLDAPLIIVSHAVVVIILQITHVRVRVRERGALDGFP